MKISIITVVYNGEKYIEDCINSVLSQDYKNIEYIVIDGASTDNTLQIVNKFSKHISVVISEKDAGLYDAMNKGIGYATGKVIGFVHADDLLAAPDILTAIAAKFSQSKADAVFGDLNYVSSNTQKILRKWVSYQAGAEEMKAGWMPAHPTFYLKKEIYSKIGGYSLDFGTAADYELMIRAIYTFKINAVYLNKLILNMRIGGKSNAGIGNLIRAFRNDYRAAKLHAFPFPFFTILVKKLIKIRQFFL